MGNWPEVWAFVEFALHLSGAVFCTIATGWIWRKGDRNRSDHRAVIAALSLTALWCILTAAFGTLSFWSSISEVVCNLSWMVVLYRLFANDGRNETLHPIKPVLLTLVLVECLQVVFIAFGEILPATAGQPDLIFQVPVIFRLLVVVGALVLLHNLYVGATQSVRPVLRWTAAALAAMWSFNLNYYAIGYLGGGFPLELTAIRGLVMASVALPLAIGSTQSAATILLRPSRKVTFQTLSLLVVGSYLLLTLGIVKFLSIFGGDISRITQVVFTFAATVVVLLWLPSHRLRGWVRVTAIKHLFQHRYDYRAEWLQFTQTMGQNDGTRQTLQERIIKSMADITESPSGLLLLPSDNGPLELASQWNWKEAVVPADNPIPDELLRLFESRNFILDVDDIRAGRDWHGETVLLPDWLRNEEDAWALVPLLHFDRMVGVIVLSRPAEPRRLDWEDFDLLRVVGQQLANYLAEQAGQAALMESARFDEFNRRIAFVMHDIKNLASQLALLSSNAERHVDNPEFRADMLVTLKNSANKLKGLLARLNRYGTSGLDKREQVNVFDVAKQVVGQYDCVQLVSNAESESGRVLADGEGLEQALVHLVQNAIDASEAGSPVTIAVNCDSAYTRIEVTDTGCGMSAEFIREGLFKPFVSSKNSGFGIGAFEAREVIRAMGGRLDVESREGFGTRFTISFPIEDSANFSDHNISTHKNEAA